MSVISSIIKMWIFPNNFVLRIITIWGKITLIVYKFELVISAWNTTVILLLFCVNTVPLKWNITIFFTRRTLTSVIRLLFIDLSSTNWSSCRKAFSFCCECSASFGKLLMSFQLFVICQSYILGEYFRQFLTLFF